MITNRAYSFYLFGLPLAFALGCTHASRDDQHVVAYVAVDRKDAEPILRDFSRETGVEVRAVYDAEIAKTSALVSRLLAEAERPRCDLFWNNENVQTCMLAERGLLDEARGVARGTLSSSWNDPAGRWVAIATRARVIVYNSKYVKADEAPRSIFDLTKPKWKGKIAIANPQFGTTRTYIAALFAILGPPAAQQLLLDLIANDVRIVDGNAMVKNLVARADPAASPVFAGLTDTDDVLAGQAEGEPVELIYPDQDSIGTLLVPTTVSVLRGAPHPAAARRLFEFLASPDAVNRLAKPGSGYSPLSPPNSSESAPSAIRSFKLSPDELLKQLEPSTQWTRQNFHS